MGWRGHYSTVQPSRRFFGVAERVTDVPLDDRALLLTAQYSFERPSEGRAHIRVYEPVDGRTAQDENLSELVHVSVDEATGKHNDTHDDKRRPETEEGNCHDEKHADSFNASIVLLFLPLS